MLTGLTVHMYAEEILREEYSGLSSMMNDSPGDIITGTTGPMLAVIISVILLVIEGIAGVVSAAAIYVFKYTIEPSIMRNNSR